MNFALLVGPIFPPKIISNELGVKGHTGNPHDDDNKLLCLCARLSCLTDGMAGESMPKKLLKHAMQRSVQFGVTPVKSRGWNAARSVQPLSRSSS